MADHGDVIASRRFLLREERAPTLWRTSSVSKKLAITGIAITRSDMPIAGEVAVVA